MREERLLCKTDWLSLLANKLVLRRRGLARRSPGRGASLQEGEEEGGR